MRDKRILLAEDSATQAEVLKAVLEEHGLTVDLAASGEEALAALKKSPYDLVVSDVVMPGMSGYELCTAIKSRKNVPEIPVVLLTSLSDPMAIVRGLECGADNYVTKPYTPDYLLARIRHTLDRYTLRPSAKTSMGVNVQFLDTEFTITSDREQILDLFISSIEDVVRTNDALQASQRELAQAQRQLEDFASRMAHQAQVTAEKYSALMHSASDAIFVLDEAGVITEANARASELLARNARNLRGSRLDDLAVNDSREVISAQLGRVAGLARVTASEVEFGRGDETRIYCDLSASRARTRDGEFTLVILHDVTDRREAAERLRRDEAQLSEGQKLAQLGSFEWQVQTNEVSWSDEMYAIFGRDPASFSPSYETYVAAIHPEDRQHVAETVQEALAGTRAYQWEHRFIRADGAVRHMAVRGEVWRDKAGAPLRVIGVGQDITERVQLEQQLLQSQKMEAIGQLAGGVAHDFNNLLTVITSYVGFVQEQVPADSSAQSDLEEIRHAAESATALTRQLLAFSRKQVLQPRPLQLGKIARSMERMLGRLIGEHIELVLDLADDDVYVLADPGQIEQTLMNLAVNARDAMPQGGRLTISTAATDLPADPGPASTLKPGPYAALTVADTGAGMDDEVRSHLFEPFFTTKPQGHGTGLGLATVYGIVKQSGGSIDVRSALGEGATFTILLPRVAGDAAAEETGVADVRATAPAAESGSILLVEDEPQLRALARRILERGGYRVLEAENGEDAIARCAELKDSIDLILTDVVMPRMTARDMVDRLTGECGGVPVLFMSGYAGDDVLRRGLADPGMNFLQKPFSPASLLDKVAAVLRSSAADEAV